MTNRDRILAAAQRQLNQDPTSSMADVAEAAGVGRATLHRHFATREGLLAEIGVRSLERWESRLDENQVAQAAASGDRARIQACLEAQVEDFVADAEDFGFALTDTSLDTSAAHVERVRVLFDREVELYAAAQGVGLLRSDVPARWLGHALYGLLVAARDALVDGDVARRDLGAVVLSTFLEGTRS